MSSHAQLHVCMSRVARLDHNGVPLPGASNLYVSKALMTVTIKPELETTEGVTRKNGCGDLLLQTEDEVRYKKWLIDANWGTFDPYLHELLVGGTLITQGGGAPPGYAYPAIGEEPNPDGVSWEFWVKRGNASGVDPDYPYARWRLPLAKLSIGDRAHSDTSLENPMTGTCLENENFYDGPNQDWPTNIGWGPAWIPVAASDVPEDADGYLTLAAS